MKQLNTIIAVLAVSAVALSAVGSSGATSMPKMTKLVGAYKLTLVVGPAETMSMSHAKTGERMIGGKNATCHMGMTMYELLRVAAKGKTPDCNHHIELHVYKRSNGSTVKNARVSISLRETTGGHMMIMVPIMTMVGQAAKTSDFHYGNNVYAAPGKYNVDVSVNSTKATFMGVSLTSANGM